MYCLKKAVAVLSLSLFALTTYCQNKKQDFAIISGYFSDGKGSDTVRVLLWRHYITYQTEPDLRADTIQSVCKNGHFKIRIDNIKRPLYFSLDNQRYKGSKQPSLLSYYFVSAGDSIYVRFPAIKPIYMTYASGRIGVYEWGIDKLKFSGKGSSKCQYLFDSRKKEREDARRLVQMIKESKESGAKIEIPVLDSTFFSTYPSQFHRSIEFTDSIIKVNHSLLSTYKNNLSNEDYLLLKANSISEISIRNAQDLAYYIAMVDQTNAVSFNYKIHLLDTLSKMYKNHQFFSFRKIPSTILVLSRNYLDFRTKELSLAKYIYGQSGYSIAKKEMNPLLRDKLITNYLVSCLRLEQNTDSVLRDALKFVGTNFCVDILNKKYTYELTGSKAYSFSLPDVNSKYLSLSDLKGKIVFIDFWYTGCGGCAAFYQNQLSIVEEQLKNIHDIVFITISVDEDKDVWKRSLKEGRYTSTGLGNVFNLFTEGKGRDHPLINAYNVVSYPRPMIIDKEGKIFKASNVPWKAEELLKIFNELMSKKS